MTQLARFISTVLNPFFLVLPTPFFLIYKTTGQIGYAFQWTVFTALFLGILLLITLYGMKKGYFSDLDVSNRKQRQKWYVIITFIALFYFLSVLGLHGPNILIVGIVSIIVSLLILSLINTKVKASLHVASLSALIFAVGIFYGGLQLLWLLLIPVVAWSRVKIHRHTVQEVVVGAIVGSALTLIMYFVFKYMMVLPI